MEADESDNLDTKSDLLVSIASARAAVQAPSSKVAKPSHRDEDVSKDSEQV